MVGKISSQSNHEQQIIPDGFSVVEQIVNNTYLLRQSPPLSEDNHWDVINKYSFPNSLAYLYQMLDCEIEAKSIGGDYGSWSLIPLRRIDHIQSIFNTCDEYTGCSVDFAHRYMGMGHVCVASWYPETQTFYYRHDGGANGWEQLHCAELAYRMIPTESERFPIEYWFSMLHESKSRYIKVEELHIAQPSTELYKKCWDIINAQHNS